MRQRVQLAGRDRAARITALVAGAVALVRVLLGVILILLVPLDESTFFALFFLLQVFGQQGANLFVHKSLLFL